MVPALLMFRRAARALRYAVREDEFVPVLSSGVVLLVLGTLTISSSASGSSWRSCAAWAWRS